MPILATPFALDGEALDDLRSIESPDCAFHVTLTSSVPSIVRGGLVPQIGPRSRRAEHGPGVFLFTNVDAMLLHAGLERGWLPRHVEDGAEMSVLGVNTKGLIRWDRPAEGWEFATRHPVAASRIKVLGRWL